MTDIADNYAVYYADKLWNLLPGVYRAVDTDDFSTPGPLREMVNRIGAQAAALRRSIDRTWEDQSIETCDDWLIPYIGELVATNLVSNLDAAAQRRDVAKTIYYRRRKGTVSLLEELASDITGWDARVIEFFRRIGRTRHGLDPRIGQPVWAGDDTDALQQAEGIVGKFTRTPIGGTANLRNAYGASKAHSPFDEFFHTADFRRGQGQTGWHNIPRLGLFLWRLKSYGMPPTTAVAVTSPTACPGWYTVDPTGRDVPLFAEAARKSAQYGDAWVSPVEEQLPGPISQAQYNANAAVPPPAGRVLDLYGESIQIYSEATPKPGVDSVPVAEVIVRPERGRFFYNGSPIPTTPAVSVPAIHLGPPPPPPAVPAAPPAGTLAPTHAWSSYYYGFSSDIGAGPYDRRVGRTTPPAPLPAATVSGGVALTGTAAISGAGTLTLNDSLTYPSVADVQVTAPLTIAAQNKHRPLIRLPAAAAGATSQWVITGHPGASLVLDGLFISGGDVVLRGTFQSVLITCCTLDPGTGAGVSATAASPYAISADGRLLAPTCLWVEAQIESVTIERSITGPVRTRAGGAIQKLCIHDSILQALPAPVPTAPMPNPTAPPQDGAIDLEDGEVCLSRCTVLGKMAVHQLRASECLLLDTAIVDDTRHSCVRFSAWSVGSTLPSQYESVSIQPLSALFTSVDFGQPGYSQLRPTADDAILPSTDGAIQNSISEGAENGSEMGAFSRDGGPLKQRGLMIKFQEYMPFGLVPVMVFVT